MNKILGIRAFLLRRGEGKERRMFTPETLIIAWIIIVIAEISEGQDFRIDNQLRILVNDCYTRIAIGSRLPQTGIITTIRGNSLSDCETACTNNRTVCNAFSFGIDGRGNGTCTIGRMDVNTRGKDLIIDPDYDVYERRARMPRGCQHDRLLKIGYGDERPKTNLTTLNGMARHRNVNGTSRSKPINHFGKIFGTKNPSNVDPFQEPSFFRGGWYSPIANDDDTRLYDILNGKKNFKTVHTNDHTFGVTTSPYDFYHPTIFENSPIDTKSNVQFFGHEPTWNFDFSRFLSTSPFDSYTTTKNEIHPSQFGGTIGYGYPRVTNGIDPLLDKTKREYVTESN